MATSNDQTFEAHGIEFETRGAEVPIRDGGTIVMGIVYVDFLQYGPDGTEVVGKQTIAMDQDLARALAEHLPGVADEALAKGNQVAKMIRDRRGL